MRLLCFACMITCSLLFMACNSNTAENDKAADDTTVSYRPLYHFTTDSNWINDPNGLVFANGKYHLFAQYNPFGDKWGHMSWAHAVSTDLFSWQQQPLAIPEILNADSSTTMIFSGSAVVDSLNTSGFGKEGQMPLVSIYTSHIDRGEKGTVQHQSIAYSLDEGLTWKQYEKNPVLDVNLKDFRDPKVFWYAPGNKWIMLVVKPDQYKVEFYASQDLKKWTFLSDFGGMGNMTKIWECPDIYQLPIEGTSEKKWVISVSAGHPVNNFLAMQYFIGEFDGTRFIADKGNYPLYIDYGKDNYAGITYNNIPASDGRKIMIGWANCWNYANDIPTKGFRGMYTVPRVLSLRKADRALVLVQHPVTELDQFTTSLFNSASVELNNKAQLLESAKGSALDISFTVEAGAGATAGIRVLKTGDEATTIAYNASTQQLILDRTKSGDTSFNAAFASVETLPVKPINGKLNIRILVDKSIVEVFVHDGAVVLTDLVFPKHSGEQVELFAENGKAVFTDIKVKQVKKTLH